MQFIITIMHGEERKLRKKEKQQMAFNVQQLVSEGNINQPNRIESRLSGSTRKGLCYLVTTDRINHYNDIYERWIKKRFEKIFFFLYT